MAIRINYYDKTYHLAGKVRWTHSTPAGSFILGVDVVNKPVIQELSNDLSARDFIALDRDRRDRFEDRRTKPDSHRKELRSQKIARVPHDDRQNYTPGFVKRRRNWIGNVTKTQFKHLSELTTNPEELKGNIENLIGAAQVPIGVVGPLLIKGEHATGTFYVPLATTEGGLISTYQRGAIAITKSGGARVQVKRDENYLDPVFVMKNMEDADRFVRWLQEHRTMLEHKVQEVTQHGKLLSVEPVLMGRRIVLKISYQTSDAMGANMINFATEAICQFVTRQFKVESYFLRSNMSSEKKAAGVNLTTVYGKEVYVEAIIPKSVVKLYLNSTPTKISQAWHSWALGSIHAGMLGINAQLSNGLAGMFIACGQDVAHITNASVGINMLELLDNEDLYASLKLPNLIVGTVGGGTGLGTQRECLEMIGCYGKGKAKRLAEIVGATLLAGELGICAGLTSGQFLAPHIKAATHTRAKAYKDTSGNGHP